jgi:hypothetical protein
MDGDTLVYNADAFQMAEGSMLDALIKKLPGVELEAGGVIKVNGRQVSSLLLNGNMLHPRQVRLGECNYDYIEVISGLSLGEQVIVSDMTKYKGKKKLKVD